MTTDRETFTIDGFLLATPADGWVRLLAAGVYFDVAEEGLVDVEPLPAPPHLRPSAAVRVRVVLRRGCPMGALGDGGSLYEQLWERPSPFSFAARDEAGFPQPPEFDELERAYLDELDAYDRGVQ